MTGPVLHVSKRSNSRLDNSGIDEMHRSPMAARRTVALKSGKFKLEEMDTLMGKIMSSSLLTMQKTDGLKSLLQPSIDFHMLNGEVGVKQLLTAERKIKRATNDDMRVKGVPVECHDALWRDRGPSYPSLQDKGDILAIRSFA
jgi:hypothetical protein